MSDRRQRRPGVHPEPTTSRKHVAPFFPFSRLRAALCMGHLPCRLVRAAYRRRNQPVSTAGAPSMSPAEKDAGCESQRHPGNNTPLDEDWVAKRPRRRSHWIFRREERARHLIHTANIPKYPVPSHVFRELQHTSTHTRKNRDLFSFAYTLASRTDSPRIDCCIVSRHSRRDFDLGYDNVYFLH